MRRSAGIALLLTCLVTALPATADITGVTADGTWDCPDPAGNPMAAVVVVDGNYALLHPDGTINAYGKLHVTAEQTDLPQYIVISGPLKDELAVQAMGFAGPPDHPHLLDGELFLTLVVDTDHITYCTRRKAPEA